MYSWTGPTGPVLCPQCKRTRTRARTGPGVVWQDQDQDRTTHFEAGPGLDCSPDQDQLGLQA